MVGARVRTVVFGAWEPRTGACGSVFDVARESPLHELEVRGGVLPDECEDLVREFFSSRR
jgi:tRNA(adenine34) deaminase